MAAKSEVNRLSFGHRALSDQLKQRRTAGAPEAELSALRARGVQLEAELEAADTRLREAERALGAALRLEVASVDRQIKALIPGLRVGPLADRRQAARTIQSLRSRRRELREELAGLQPRPSDDRWGAYAVRIDPLDGPEELLEKADYVDDARDKLSERRRALVELLTNARRARRVEAAAETFAAESRLFDETTRPGRVIRGAGGAVAALADDESANDPGFQAGAPTRGGMDAQAPEVGGGAETPVPTAPSDDTTALLGAGSEFGRGPTGGEQAPTNAAPPPAAAPDAAPRSGELDVASRDLGQLLELDPSRFDPRSATPDELDAWLARLARAEKQLEGASRRLRDRAAKLSH